MEGVDHLSGLGKIIGNLHTLELMLGIFLCKAHGENVEFPESSMGTVPETHLTNFMTLGELIAAYNSALAPAESAYSVDPVIVKVRDAIAHGRLTSVSARFPLTLYKFGKPDKMGVVPIELVEEISETWLDQNRQRIFDDIEKISNCARARSFGSL